LDARGDGRADRWIRRTTTGFVGMLALIAGTISCLHMHTQPTAWFIEWTCPPGSRLLASACSGITECKFWNRAVPKEKVSALKDIVNDLGARRGRRSWLNV
jgi:hypothetical protein